MTEKRAGWLEPTDVFADRHIGPRARDKAQMLGELGVSSLDALIAEAVPASIRTKTPLGLEAMSERALLETARALASRNRVCRSYIGMGYHGCVTPPVIQRNILENPGWYTQYTPYQAEIAQGRLEALLNFQTMIMDLTGMALANASLLDEGTAAAEAMAVCYDAVRKKKKRFLVASDCHPQTIDVVKTRAEPIGVEVVVSAPEDFDLGEGVFGVLVQYPNTEGRIVDYEALCTTVREAGAMSVVATDLMALTLLRPPGDFGADIAVGNSQRFGVPMGYGGPHAAFFATSEAHRRRAPGRIVGVSVDTHGKPALRLALQTREQHIRRERATSNICTSQVLLAIVASMYAVYHGPDRLKAIAGRILGLTRTLRLGLERQGVSVGAGPVFDTIAVTVGEARRARALARADKEGINLRQYPDGRLGISLDETTRPGDVMDILGLFVEGGSGLGVAFDALAAEVSDEVEAPFARLSPFLTHPIFNSHHSETELLRYMTMLQSRDLSLTSSMIPLGSCTMKLNATAEMMPITLPGFGALHPFAPLDQAEGYRVVFDELRGALADITGFAGISLQPNAGSQGEYTGLMVIRAYHRSRGEGHRNVCLIPTSAHGTNPASAVMAGLKVVAIKCDDEGNIDLDDLRAKADKHSGDLASLMVTYPSTHGVFEEDIKEICEIVHSHRGQVYLDGANLNALVGLCRIGEIGADVCHLNLHKTFCLSAGTPVSLTGGLSRPIEQLETGLEVHAWSEDEEGVKGANLEAIFKTGKKDCVEITLEDGRKITCTPDHRVLTTEGWVEAEQLMRSSHRVVVGLDRPLDDRTSDLDSEHAFEMNCGPYEFSMRTPEARGRTLAFFRLVGAACSDGTYSLDTSNGRCRVRLYLGTRYDANLAVQDMRLLTGKSPSISSSNNVFSVGFPAELVRAFEALPGIGAPGRRVESSSLLPDVIKDPSMPKAVLREFFGGLFGGDGCSPLIVHLESNPDTMREIKFVQTRKDKDTLRQVLEEIRVGLSRLGVESTVGRIVRPVNHPDSFGKHKRARWSGHLTVVWGTAFAERVGFRYCTHKSARLSAATAWWRLKETVKTQRSEVAERAIALVASQKSLRGPKPVWGPAVEEAYRQLVAEKPVLNEYYAAFKGNTRVSRQHLTNAINGQMGKRSDIRGLRRTHRRAVFPAKGRNGDDTGMPSLQAFLSKLGARRWFNDHTPGGSGYKVTYAMKQDGDTEPTMSLGVVDIRQVGEREVYDLTVSKLHSFLANGIVVHNCIPHGGGGPGMGPIGVVRHLVPFLPGHSVVPGVSGEQGIGAVSAAPWGSPSILPISWAYIKMMGGEGLLEATRVAILNANYIAARLAPHYPILYKGARGRVAHECILDLRDLKRTSGVTVADVAKRLMDFGFHAPTISWPVAGTMMIEPTESESKAELDRFCEAMIKIRAEIRDIEEGKLDREDNPLKHAPHTAEVVTADDWGHAYSRQQAAFPAAWVQGHKFWPAVGRVNDAFGDRNLVCACPPVEAFAEE